jgi:AhpD family alkylhydroperoxidase
MVQRLDPYAVAPKEMQELISLHAFLDSSGLEESLIELLRLHVSRLNGCTQAVRRHSRRASALGETTARLAALGAWRSALPFTEREKVALEWAEAVSFISRSHVLDGAYAAIRQWFTDMEIVKLTLIIAATTAWNRVELSFISQKESECLSQRHSNQPRPGACAPLPVEAE